MPNELCSTPQVEAVTDGSIRCCFYGRYSSDNQREASIEDQFRECRQLAQRKGWVVLEHLNQSDEEKSGTTRFNRPGLDNLTAIAKARPKAVEYFVYADTSRLGRNAAETLQIVKIYLFHGISLHFVEDGLDSRDPSFWENFTRKATDDERYSRSLGAKTRRGRKGRFLAGYNPGGGCYGYRNVPDYDYTKKGMYGQPFVIGVKQEIDPETSKVVIRIFESYSEGMSYRDIAVMLNSEGIPTSQRPRRKLKASWSKHAIQTILENGRYIGQLHWDRTYEESDPETGKRSRRVRPRDEWEFREDPSLRIVSDELWTSVQQNRQEKTRIGVQKGGGMCRTEASRRYLLSGLMKCGECGDNINVVTTNPTRYGCSNHRYRGDCTNKFTIRQDQLEQTFLAALADKMRSEELHEEMVEAVHKHLIKINAQKRESARSTEAQRRNLESNRAELVRQKQNVLKAIREMGGRRSLYEELDDVDGRIDRIDVLLATAVPPAAPEITLEEVRAFIDGQRKSFEELLLASPERVKSELQKRISSITLTPSMDERGLVYKVTGDVDFFSLPEDGLQTNQVDLIGLQSAIPVSFTIAAYQKTQHKTLRKFASSGQGGDTGSGTVQIVEARTEGEIGATHRQIEHPASDEPMLKAA